MTSGLWVFWVSIVAVWAGILSWKDCRTRHLPNALTMGGALVALVFRWGIGGNPAFLSGFAAACVAGSVLLIPFFLRGAGGGDVKMLFAAGAIVGWDRLLALLWFTSLAGLLLGLVMLALGQADGHRVRHLLRCALDWRYDRQAGVATLPSKENTQARIPFSVAITAGVLVSMTA